MSRERNINTLTLDGGHLCFDFINTVHTRTEEEFHEYLPDYQEFILWCRKVAIVEKVRLDALADEAAQHPQSAARTIKKIKETRENLYQLFSAIAADQFQQMPARVLQNYNTSLTEALSHLQFAIKENKLQQTWSRGKLNLEEPLWIVLKAAYDLLTNEDYSRMKECAACGWLFLDQTKNNKRRWCSPSTCGSIEKSKRYYQKKKKLHTH